VVILGQDPYHEPNQAHGLSFSVKEGVALPPSLKNIFKEIESDLGIKEPPCGDLTKWAKSGVLLLNTTLTVREHLANSHSKCGWAWFTDNVIKIISDRKQNVVFILWGGNARSKAGLIDRHKHLILECAHPSPLSAYAGFFGCKFFSKTNSYLLQHGIEPVNWDLNT
jgi:uracil-DNA glycosylase